MKILILILTFTLSYSAFALELWANPPQQLPANVREWLTLEVKVNPGSSSARTDQAIRLEHIEIPAQKLDVLKGLGLRQDILGSLIFVRDGQTFVRWIFNPEDTIYKGQILDELGKTGNRPLILRDRFIGYLTASRSVVVQDAITGTLFSLKASTNQTGGQWHDKKMNSVAAKISKAYNDFIVSDQHHDQLNSLVVLKEPLAVILASIDISFTIRDYPLFSNKSLRMIPFFSALHSTYGKEFAERFREDPTNFWRKHMSEPWGRAMAEGLSQYGFYPNSAHSQDFLVELNAVGNPTGRILARDIMDSDGERMILEARGAKEVLAVYETSKKISAWSGRILMKAIPFNGHSQPEWMNVNIFMDGFVMGFRSTYQDMTGVKSLPNVPGSSWTTINHEVGNDSDFIRWTAKLQHKSVSAGLCRSAHRHAM